jgi:hypothetical protein
MRGRGQVGAPGRAGLACRGALSTDSTGLHAGRAPAEHRSHAQPALCRLRRARLRSNARGGCMSPHHHGLWCPPLGTAMGHNHHFPSRLDRVSGARCELALVRRILFAANIEGTSDRIAVVLATGDGDPHIIRGHRRRGQPHLESHASDECPHPVGCDLRQRTAAHALWTPTAHSRTPD